MFSLCIKNQRDVIMFGYIRPLVSDLKVGDYGYYKAAYCGLCRQMGKICGKSSRVCLSYDMVFLMLVRAWLQGENNMPDKRRCSVNPLQTRKMLPGSAAMDYAAAVSGMLASLRFSDDVADETGVRRFGARCGSRVSSKWVRRGEKMYPGLYDGIESRLSALYEKEKAYYSGEISGPAADDCAELFGDVLAFVCAYGLEGDRRAKAIASAVGKYTGRWNYLVDAADDIAGDEKKHRFNPFLSSYGRSEFTADDKLTLSCLLAAEAGAAADAFALADMGDGNPSARRIVENILRQGMPDTSNRVLSGEYRKPRHDSV